MPGGRPYLLNILSNRLTRRSYILLSVTSAFKKTLYLRYFLVFILLLLIIENDQRLSTDLLISLELNLVVTSSSKHDTSLQWSCWLNTPRITGAGKYQCRQASLVQASISAGKHHWCRQVSVQASITGAGKTTSRGEKTNFSMNRNICKTWDITDEGLVVFRKLKPRNEYVTLSRVPEIDWRARRLCSLFRTRVNS
jgi:hypothetical protein